VRLNERTFAEFDDVPEARVPISEFVDSSAVTAQWRSMVERDAEFRVVMLEYLLYAMRNPEARERAVEFAHDNMRHIAEYIRQHAAEVGEVPPLPIEDLAGVFGIASDGFAQAALIDPGATRLFALALDLITRGIQSYAHEAADQAAADS
jgi:hypothetical protein